MLRDSGYKKARSRGAQRGAIRARWPCRPGILLPYDGVRASLQARDTDRPRQTESPATLIRKAKPTVSVLALATRQRALLDRGPRWPEQCRPSQHFLFDYLIGKQQERAGKSEYAVIAGSRYCADSARPKLVEGAPAIEPVLSCRRRQRQRAAVSAASSASIDIRRRKSGSIKRAATWPSVPTTKVAGMGSTQVSLPW